MTLEPDNAELAPSRDPAAYGRRPLFGFSFWAMMVLALAFMAAGYGFARFGPQIFPEREDPAQTAPPAKATPALGLTAAPPPPRAPATATPPPATPFTPLTPAVPPVAAGPAAGPVPATGAAAPEDATLAARVTRLEGAEQAVVNAAAAALAAAQLSAVAQSSRPFAEELTAVWSLMPASADARALARHAQTGVPSRAALAAEFTAEIQPTAVAVRAPGAEAGLLARIGYALSSIVTVRRIGPDDRGREEALSRLERLVREGDLEGALREIDTLPGAARDQLGHWRLRAERRVEVDRRVAAIRAEALAGLTRAGAGR